MKKFSAYGIQIRWYRRLAAGYDREGVKLKDQRWTNGKAWSCSQCSCVRGLGYQDQGVVEKGGQEQQPFPYGVSSAEMWGIGGKLEQARG